MTDVPCFNDGTQVTLGMHRQQEVPSKRVVVAFLRKHAALRYHILFWQWQPCMVIRFVH